MISLNTLLNNVHFYTNKVYDFHSYSLVEDLPEPECSTVLISSISTENPSENFCCLREANNFV